MDKKDHKKGDGGSDEFVRLLLANERKIYTFILTLVSNRSDADDIMQETASLMWGKFEGQQGGVSNFAAWGIRIAHFKVLEFRKHQYRKHIQFEGEMFDRIIGGAISVSEELDERIAAMRDCLGKLDQRSRLLVQNIHQHGSTIKNTAEQLGISITSAYKAVPRIHDILLRCIQTTLRAKGVL